MEERSGALERRACPSNAGDAPYSFDCSTYTSTVTCPKGIQGKKGGIGQSLLRLVPVQAGSDIFHALSSFGSWNHEHWGRDLAHWPLCDAPSDLRVRPIDPDDVTIENVTLNFGFCRDGYDVCYVTIPERSLGDAQVNAEYVAYNIQDLAAKSSTGTFASGRIPRLVNR